MFPTADAVDGVTGTGYTVERGTTADEFSAKVLGRITDGIAPGVDMIMAELDSPALERAGGVWGGMSGSPVYAADGKLIGSVSYGLAASSKIAGITPAEDLMALRDSSTGRPTISVSQQKAARIAKTGEASKTLAAKGFERLPVPVSASGIAKKNTKRYLSGIAKSSGLAVRSGGSKISTKAESSPSEIFAGSNYTAALSYGDVSLTGLGTTTYVCDGTAVAFGHPFLSAGRAEFSVHPATAVYVQADPVFGPFKVGNPGGVVGTVTRDNTVGLRSTLGQAPKHDFPITTSLVNEEGKTVKGSTVGVYQAYVADIAALHLQSAVIKANGAQGAGSAEVKITVTGTRAGGKKFSLSHSDHFADSLDVSYPTADSLYFLLLPLVEQSFEDVKITGVKITGKVTTDIEKYRVAKVETKKKGKWVKLTSTQSVSSGATIPLRATLTAYRSTKQVTVPLTVRVPKKSSGYTGALTISDGLSALPATREPNSLNGLLNQLRNTPSSDSVISQVDLDTPTGGVLSSTRKTKLDAAVSPYLKLASITVK
ncbi:SpoIVB peptidase S55 domain-containing protein [Kineosporia babensis]